MNSSFARIDLAPGYSISRVIKGGWQLAGGHGTIDEKQAVEDMRSFVEAGVTTFDCADIYTGVEELIGKFLKKYNSAFKSGELSPVQIHTKYVPDLNQLPTLTKSYTEAVIDRSLKRLNVDHLDLVQFHWWDYSIKRDDDLNIISRVLARSKELKGSVYALERNRNGRHGRIMKYNLNKL